MSHIDVLTVQGADPVDRGRQLAGGAGTSFATGLRTYEALFGVAGVTPAQVEGVVEGTRGALTDWAPDLAAEIDAYADTAGVERWRLHALNARTEVLALGDSKFAGECSTIVHAAPGAMGAQTWDWHAQLSESWHVVQHRNIELPFVTLTERGMVGKIGLNAAGVGLLFNILGHESDGSGRGVPVHAVARRVLDTAVSVEHAIDIVRSAPVQASSCLTVLDPESVACLEMAPAGVAAVGGGADWVIHTNHFTDPELCAGGRFVAPEEDTVARASLLAERVRASYGPVSRDALVQALCAHEGPDGAGVCCHPYESGALGMAWETLATIVLDPVARSMSVLRGGPCEAESSPWRPVSVS